MGPIVSAHKKYEESRLLVVGADGVCQHSYLGALSSFLNAGDVLVVNRSATIPASFQCKHQKTGKDIELRLAAFQGSDHEKLSRWGALVLGEGDWSLATEQRIETPTIKAGDELFISAGFKAKVEEVLADRLINIQLISENLVRDIYKFGSLIQYSYHRYPLQLWDVQTIFGSPAISVEPPSASLQFNWSLISQLKSKGIVIGEVLHSAGISSTGCESLDKQLPLPEYSMVYPETIHLIKKAKEKGHRVIALGTTSVRAIESSWNGQELISGPRLSRLRILPDYKLACTDAIITGIHEPSSSHGGILQAFADKEIIDRAHHFANLFQYKNHEFGDLMLINGK